MTSEPDFSPPRLAQGDDPDARALVGSARTDAPRAELRAASVARVLAEYRQRRTRQRLGWVALGSVAAVAAGVLLWLRLQPAPETLVAREVRPSPSALTRGAAPPPSASAPAVPPDLQPCAPAVRAAGSAPLIDDFEDNDTRIAPLEHRAGFWNISNDGTNTQWPPLGSFPMSRIPGGRGTSQFALRVHGGKFTKWGVLTVADLSARRCYDASAYAGLSFWTRGKGHFSVGAKMTQIAPEEYGGSCTHDCFDSHRVTITLSNQWQEQRLTWADFKQQGFGQPLPFDPRSLLSLEFAVWPDQTPFDFWVDDLRFIER